jgi:Fe-S oxidoreductase
MNPVAMTVLLLAGFGVFSVSIARRWRSLFSGATRRPGKLGDWRKRWARFVRDGLLQSRLRQYKWAGWAHTFIFFGFVVLLARTVMLWGRGFDTQFDLWVLGAEPVLSCPLGSLYCVAKDCSTALVLLAVGFFALQRLWCKPARLRLSSEGLLILLVIALLMLSDEVYEGASLVLASHWDRECAGVQSTGCAKWANIVSGVGWHLRQWQWRWSPDPLGSLVGLGLRGVGPSALVRLAMAGFWSHSVLVLLFLNWLPYSKHFHILTALPNLFLAPVGPAGKLSPIAGSAEALLEQADRLQSTQAVGIEPIGISRIVDLTWKERLDLYSCTECGRCSENCPAHRTDKPLSPMQLTLELRSALLDNSSRPALSQTTAQATDSAPEGSLVPRIIKPETLWACTACRACEQQCPVGIGYVGKIVSMRRELVMMRAEVPSQLQKSFEGMERNGNPWNLSRQQRADWSNGLDVQRLKSSPGTDVLYWVGCAASYDNKAQRVARAMATLMRQANVDFAILGDQECCTGDAARRAGNEYLFLQLAEKNVATLNRYYDEQKFKRIVTACPHCLTTLKNEYPDFGGSWPILHHAEFLLELVESGRLRPKPGKDFSVTVHDPCTLARYDNDVVSVRRLLGKLSGVSLREAEHNRRFTLCCGAGGARFWMDEGTGSRMNVARSRELLATHASQFVTACPFCSTMLGDGVAQLGSAPAAEVLDIAEVLEKSCVGQARGASLPE